MWQVHRDNQDDLVGRGQQHEFNKSSLLSQYGFNYIQRAKDSLKDRLAQVYEEKEQNIEDLLVLGDSKADAHKSRKKERKREKKERRKKKKKKRRASSSSSSSSESSDGAKARRMSEVADAAGPVVP